MSKNLRFAPLVALLLAGATIAPSSAIAQKSKKKKKAKQEKYLFVADGLAATGISVEEIKNEVIVFDGTTSDPPPPISPPSNVSTIFF